MTVQFIREQKTALGVSAAGAAVLACEPKGNLRSFAVSAFALGLATAALSHANLSRLRRNEKPYMKGLIR